MLQHDDVFLKGIIQIIPERFGRVGSFKQGDGATTGFDFSFIFAMMLLDK